MVLVVKRRGYTENFDERKLYASVYAACASAHYQELQCEKTAGEVSEKITGSIKHMKTISSLDIRKMVEKELKIVDKNLPPFYMIHLPDIK